MAEPIPRPPTLRAFLEAGADLSAFPLVEGLAEVVLVQIPTWTPAKRQRWATLTRRDAETVIEGDGLPWTVEGRPADKRQARACFDLWTAELIEDPELRAMFVDALPEPMVARYVHEADLQLRQHPLVVGAVGDDLAWSCGNCGEAHDPEDPTPALTIGDRPGFSDLDYPIRYCLDCVRGALTEKG